jgi:alpha-glucoside transport system permease protein
VIHLEKGNQVAADPLILASTASESASRLFGVIEAVAGFLAILIVVFVVAGRVKGRLQRPLTIVICLVPAVLLAIIGLVGPAINTVITSFTNQQALTQPPSTTKTIGFQNYWYAFTDPYTRSTLIRTLQWLIIVPIASVVVGLLIALLVDRMKFSAVPKTLIFLPTAISFVGASLIWAYVYNAPVIANNGKPGQQTGLLSQFAIKLGWHNPPSWLTASPGNIYLEMVILVWIEAGFAMVVLGAALKAIPDEILEAARMDGANGFTLFRTVQIPMIRTTLVVVGTTITIATLKLYDIVQTINNGDFNTDVLAHQMYNDMFVTSQVGRGAALAVILFICVIPLVAYNVVQLRKERAR